MNEFWLWFWRPIAETLGVIALLAFLAGMYVLGSAVADKLFGRKGRK